MSKYQTPCRYDFVGSFLRPQEVKQAKADYAEGKISEEEKDRIIDAAITDVVKKQKELGYHVITDGEFRRTYWHLDFMWGFEGVGHEQTGGGVQFHEELASMEDTYLTGKVKAKPHPFVEYFKFLKQFEDENTVAKYTIPAPAQMFQQMIVPANYANTRKYYPTNEELIHDIGVAYQEVIRQFYDAGCRNLQLDDCTWGAIVGDAAKQRYKLLGLDLEEVKKELLKAIRKVPLPAEDTALECNEILQDLAVNYQNEGLYGDFLDPVLELSAAISEGEWDEVLEEKWNIFLQEWKKWDVLIRKFLMNEIFSDLVAADSDLESLILRMEWIALEYAGIRQSAFLNWSLKGEGTLAYETLRDAIVVLTRMTGYEEEDIREYLENSFESPVWEWGYFALVLSRGAE